MAVWCLASQFLLVALLSWDVHCFPAKKGWSQTGPVYEGSFTNVEASPSFRYSSSKSAFASPANVNQNTGFPEGYPRRSYKPSLNPAPELSNVASLKDVSRWGPEDKTAPSSFVSRTPQPRPDISFPPPQFQAGELAHFEESYGHGSDERETQDQGPALMVSQLGPEAKTAPSSFAPRLDIFPPPPPQFQAGELAYFEESYEHGGDERETQDQGPMLIAPQLGGFASTQEASGVQQFLRPDYQSQYYLFLTGQLPPGTVTHSQSEYEQGRDHWDDVHYERYGFPIVSLPAQNQYVPALGSSQNPGQLSHYAAQPTPRLDYFLPTKQR